jgi:hypothetical protein
MNIILKQDDMDRIRRVIQQLERSERGQMTCKLLRDFFKSNTAKFLDEKNQIAVCSIVCCYTLGNSTQACEVMNLLNDVVERNELEEK